MFNTDLEADRAVTTSRRPIPLVARPDLVVEQVGFQRNEHWVVKIPTTLRYFRLRPEQYFLLKSLDGRTTLESLHDRFCTEFPTTALQLTDIQRVAIDLYEKGLAYSDRPGQGASLIAAHRRQRRERLLSGIANLLYLRLPGWDAYRTLNWLHRYCRWLFHPAAVLVAATLVLVAWGLLLVQFDQFQSRLPAFHQFFGWPNVMYLWITLACTKILHELGHALTCKHFGGECHEIGVMLLVFSPTLYCDVSDSWLLRNKWKRIAIGAAGMAVETVLSAFAIFIWWNTQPGLLNHVCLNLFFITTVTTVLFNANPLMRYDGYYMLSDFLEIPNLRPKADKLLRDSFAWHALGIESPPDPFMPETGRPWFVGFAIVAWIYRWIVVFGIIVFLYSFLKPYELQSVGAALAVISMSAMIFNSLCPIYKILSVPRGKPMSRPKAAITLTSLVFVVGMLLAVPIPFHFEAPFLIEPYDVKDVYTTVPGELVESDVEFGQSVRKGQVLAKLSNVEMQEKYLSLKIREQSRQAEVDMQHAMENWNAYEPAMQSLAMLKKEVAEYERQINRLTITSPCDGVIVARARRLKRTSQTYETDLGSWSGTALDFKNRNTFLDEATPVASIASNSDFQAVLLVDQADRRDLYLGQSVDFKLTHMPGQTFSGVVAEISKREVQFAPNVLSVKLGGALPTVADTHGRERIFSGVAYQAKIRLDEETPLMLTGMRGQARFLVSSRTAADWIWQYCRRTFHFRL